MVPVMWNTDAFRPGLTFVEEIESFPAEVQGAILLATPDLSCTRGGSDAFRAPVANILYEYGYLGGRLTRDRVAVCRIGDAKMPSDAYGIKLIEHEDIARGAPSLPSGLVAELKNWIARLPLLAAGISPTSQVHGYSGRWEVHNSFRTWRGRRVEDPNQVHFDGVAYLRLPVTGKGGNGVIYGTSHASLDGYEASHYSVNEVIDATVHANGDLALAIEIKQRNVIYERGNPPYEQSREDLRNRRYNALLSLDPQREKVLRGVHTYKQGLQLYSVSDEEYTQEG
jgi:hypothetical protein